MKCGAQRRPPDARWSELDSYMRNMHARVYVLHHVDIPATKLQWRGP